MKNHFLYQIGKIELVKKWYFMNCFLPLPKSNVRLHWWVLLLSTPLIRRFSCFCTKKIIPVHIWEEQALLSLSNAFLNSLFNKCVSLCSSFQYIIQCLVSAVWAIIREQGSPFISYWTVLISEALIRQGADICCD